MEKITAVAAINHSAPANQAQPSLSATCVGDIMSTNLVSVSPHHTFGEAVQLMATHRFRHFLVLHGDGKLAGVFSDRDVLRALGRTSNWRAQTVSGVMTHNVVTVRAETPLSVAAKEMLERRINCLPVLDADDKVCGIITSTDLLMTYQNIQECLETAER